MWGFFIFIEGGNEIRLYAPMPELSGATDWIHGKRTKAALIGDKPTLIHFWSISCGMCKESMPEIHKLRDQYKNQLNVIAIHVPLSDDDLDVERIRSTARKYDVKQPILVDGNLSVSNLFRNEHIPSYYLFDKNGALRHFQAGSRGMMMLEKRIQRMV